MRIATGDLRDQVVIQATTTTPDSQGGRASSWGTLATVWAHVVAMAAGEGLAAEAITSLVSYRVTLRYRADVTPEMRLSWTNYHDSAARTLEIHAIDLSPDAAWMTLTCGEVQA